MGDLYVKYPFQNGGARKDALVFNILVILELEINFFSIVCCSTQEKFLYFPQTCPLLHI